MQHRTRKQLVEHQKLHNADRRDLAVLLAVHIIRAGRLEHRRPLQYVERRADQLGVGQQDEILHIHEARNLVGTFQKTPHPPEMPAVAPRDGGVHDAEKQLAAHFDLVVELLETEQIHGLVRSLLDAQIKPVDVLPHFLRDGFADGAGVFAGLEQAGEYRVGVARVEGHEKQHVLARGLFKVLAEQLVVGHSNHQRLPLLGHVGRQVENQVEIHINETGVVFGPLHVAVDPVKRIGNA